MGNTGAKENLKGSSGQSEALPVQSRSICVHFPNNDQQYLLVSAKDTSREFLESALGKGSHMHCAVKLCLTLNAEKVMQNYEEFDEYMDNIEYIKIVPVGAAQDKPAEVECISRAIKSKK